MIFFLTFTFRGPFHRKDFEWKKIWGYGVSFWKKTEALYEKLNERTEAADDSYSVTGDFLQYIYSVPVTKNRQSNRSRCLVHDFSFTDIFNDINHGHRAVRLKKNSLYLLLFCMAVATYFYYEKVRRAMHTAVVSYLHRRFLSPAQVCYIPSVQFYRKKLKTQRAKFSLNFWR